MRKARRIVPAGLCHFQAFASFVACENLLPRRRWRRRDIGLERAAGHGRGDGAFEAVRADGGDAEDPVVAAHALQPKAAPTVSIAHLHNPAVSVREQAALITGRLQREGAVSFRSLVNDAGHVSVVVARFLALLELFREAVVAFDQVRSLGELTVRWTGGDTRVEVSAEFDEDDALGVARAADRGEEDT